MRKELISTDGQQEPEPEICPDGRNFIYDPPSTFDPLSEWAAEDRRVETVPPSSFSDQSITKARDRIVREKEIRRTFDRPRLGVGLRVELVVLLALWLLGFGLWLLSWF